MVYLRKLIDALKRMKVETGSLVCLGCGYENSCGIRGCAILRNAAMQLELLAECFSDKTVLDFASHILGLSPERLQELSKADEEGRLFVLPCRPALRCHSTNALFIVDEGEIIDDHLYEAEIGENSDGKVVVLYTTFDGRVFCEENLGKTVFLSSDEAERALKKMGEANGNG